jgi:hypothetical protein
VFLSRTQLQADLAQQALDKARHDSELAQWRVLAEANGGPNYQGCVVHIQAGKAHPPMDSTFQMQGIHPLSGLW